jgi:TetR/AcrR family transcriptional regulator, cholesterol catabolism regulator
MPTSRNGARSRDSIVQAAALLFSESGYSATTMRDIARAVGVLPGSLYAHVDGKETLLVEIVDRGIDRFLAQAEAIPRGAPPSEQLRLAVRLHVDVVAEDPSGTHVVFHQWRHLTGLHRDRVLAKRQRYEDVFTRIVGDGVASGAFAGDLDRRVAVRAILGALNWTAEWLGLERGPRAAQVGDRLADAVLWGLVAEGDGSDPAARS